MKITKELWLKATAKAMSTEAAKELFKSNSQFESLFTDYSFHLYITLKDKTITEEEYKETIADTHTELITELGVDPLNLIINLALMSFAVQIWKNLISQVEQDEVNKEYESFRALLKSQNSE